MNILLLAVATVIYLIIIAYLQTLFGVSTLAGAARWQFVDPQLVALPVSALALVLVNRFTRPVDQSQVDKRVHLRGGHPVGKKCIKIRSQYFTENSSGC
ncbi:MAG: hypothetical protein ACYC5N_09160 [Endomicrobiales bacterium]